MSSNEERGAAIGFQKGRNFDDPQPTDGAAHDVSLANSIPVVAIAMSGSGLHLKRQTAVKVADRDLEKEAAKETERRIAEIPMHEWHRPRRNSALDRFPITRSAPPRN